MLLLERRNPLQAALMRIRYEVLLFLLSVSLVYFGARVFRMLFLTLGVRGMCPKCGTVYIKRSTRRWYDLPYRAMRFSAYRCSICDFRFHLPRQQESLNAIGPSVNRGARI